MLARIRKSMDEKDQGFTLIELLVVMIIIGILSAIAIPVFLSQRSKARDTSTKSDVSTLGKELASYYTDGTGTLAVTQPTATTILVADSAGTPAYSQTIKVSAGSTLQTGTAGFKPGTAGSSYTDWCVGLTNTAGSQQTYKYTGATGLATGAC